MRLIGEPATRRGQEVRVGDAVTPSQPVGAAPAAPAALRELRSCLQGALAALAAEFDDVEASCPELRGTRFGDVRRAWQEAAHALDGTLTRAAAVIDERGTTTPGEAVHRLHRVAEECDVVCDVLHLELSGVARVLESVLAPGTAAPEGAELLERWEATTGTLVTTLGELARTLRVAAERLRERTEAPPIWAG